ncbi:hypothetical protein KS4_30030 [Poriferisphaera corsica]|uniref:Uncharacterized protein n=1 Tax=Poriferisphaera corsica TaxID=2528020 RepID=A0A517YXH2_9BACT|nr:hypothetical protein [Poriferisphaera corsica]QDU34926.1 hypothetical protein KS4_30030 [Poriferisphaera corsica]
MNTHPSYRTSTLLAAFASLTLTTPSFAGFDQMPNGHHVFFYNDNGSMTLNLDSPDDLPTIDIPVYANSAPFDIVLPTNATSWIKSTHATTLNFDGKINTHAGNGNSADTCNAISLGNASTHATHQLNFSHNSSLKVNTQSNNSYAILGIKDTLDFNDFHGQISLTNSLPNSNTIHNAAIGGRIIKFNTISQDASITTQSISSQPSTYSIFAQANAQTDAITINSLAGTISSTSVNTQQFGYTHALGAAQGNIKIQSIEETGSISASGSGVSTYTILAFHNDINIDNIHGQIAAENTNQSHLSNTTAIHASRGGINIGSISQTAVISANASNAIRTAGLRTATSYTNGSININNNFAGTINVNTTPNDGKTSIASAIESVNKIYINKFDSTGSINVAGNNLNAYGLLAANSFESNQFAGTINTLGQNNSIGIKASQIDMFKNTGTIDVQGDNFVCGILADTVQLWEVSGIISATSTNPNLQAAAISTSQWDSNTKTWSNEDDLSDLVHLQTGANIIGDIRLGTRGLNDYGLDQLILEGSGSFNHNLYGIDELQIESDPNNPGSIPRWNLDLALTPDAADQQRNIVNILYIGGSAFSATNLTVNTLKMNTFGELAIDLDNLSALTIKNAELDGILTLDNKPTDYQLGDTLTVFTADSITGKFDRHDACLDSKHSIALDYTSTEIIGTIALNGDTDFSGTIDNTDFNNMAAAYLSNDRTFSWTYGDFNQDGRVNDTDLYMMQYNTDLTFDQIKARLIPEPTTLTLFSLTALPLLRRKRRV